jgi:aminopeptidase N
MLNFRLLTLFPLFVFATAAFSDNLTDKIISPGVSIELAKSRKLDIDDIHYSLRFNIPIQEEEDITGEEDIAFKRKGSSDIILDFKASQSQLKNIVVNGKNIICKLKNEHIIIPSNLAKGGENIIHLSFIVGNKSLNRNSDYLYTLFVPDKARIAFPCFDQPDMKARYKLCLNIPRQWCAVSNEMAVKEELNNDYKTIYFSETPLLPTYLFAFVAGVFESSSCIRNGRCIKAYYRETDSTKLAQLETIFNEASTSIQWMENYTKIPYPFTKYDIIILPGFQFGGMEHAGAILFNDKRIFLGKHPTPDERLDRMELISHETSHMWFGDLVTMKWFNDVWTKEVFANYMAAKISRELFPDINHDLNFLKNYQVSALAEDRTLGTHPIQQPLENLQDAGLLYGNIIYDKAPVMMRKLEQQMGSNSFQKGLQKYLKRYAYNNATWDNLIEILDKENPKAKLKSFSFAWVKQKGMPTIYAKVQGSSLIISQSDAYHRNCIWQQSFKIALANNGIINQIIDVNMQNKKVIYPIKDNCQTIIPNYDGSGYGTFIVDDKSTQQLLTQWTKGNDINREAMLMTIYENYQINKLDADECAKSFLEGLEKEKNELVASTCCNYLSNLCFQLSEESRNKTEEMMWKLSRTHPIMACRQKLTRMLFTLATNKNIIDSLYTIWQDTKDKTLNEDDYMTLSYQLAIRKPEIWKDILAKERIRISNEDRRREFDYISRGCNPDAAEQKRLFDSLLEKENRKIEPWTQKLMGLLNCNLREPNSNRYILPGLNELQEVQRTGDIFFPKGWLTSLLSGHKSNEAKEIVENFINAHPKYPEALKNKLLQVAYQLLK